MTAPPLHIPAALGAQATTPHAAEPAAEPAAVPLRPLTTPNEPPTNPTDPTATPTGPTTTTGDAEGGVSQGRALTSNEFTAVAVVAALVTVLGLLGFVGVESIPILAAALSKTPNAM